MGKRAILEVPLEEFNESKNIMVHAWPGQGKTVWSTGAPNCVLMSCEPGAISAKRQGRRNVGLIRVHSWDDAIDVRNMVEEGDLSHRDWIIIDTISTLQIKNQNQVLDRAVAENPRRDEDIPAIQDYQKQQNSLKRWVERMIDAPINTIWLAHTMRVEDQDGGALFLPSISGGADKGYPVANYVMSLMNAVGYMEMRGKKDPETKTTKMVRRILWQPYHDPEKDIRYIAKDHFDAFGRFTDDMDFATHLKMIEGSGADAEPTEEAATQPPAKKAAPRRTRVAA